MKKILFIAAMFFITGYSFAQSVEYRVGYYSDGTMGKQRSDTIYSLPRTALEYFNGYGQFVSLADSVNAVLTTVPTSKGGTNITTYTTGDIIYASATNVLSKLPIGTSAQALRVVGGIPAWKDTAAVSTVTPSSTTTFTNKRWTARVGSTTSSATPTINTDNYDIYKLTAQTADITSFTTNLSGTPVDGDILEIQITGTAARAITWGSSFVSSTVTLPTTTVTTATLTVILQYYTTSSYGTNKWTCVNYY